MASDAKDTSALRLANLDQTALVRWIYAGLAIPEVRSLYGDAGYLLSNMVAKYSLAASFYHVSEQALASLQSQQFDLKKIYSRSYFYGKKKPFIFEHAIPASIVRDRLLKFSSSMESIREILDASGPVAIILREEDALLTEKGLRKSMPHSWQWGDNPLARYEHVGIKISSHMMNVDGKIKR